MCAELPIISLHTCECILCWVALGSFRGWGGAINSGLALSPSISWDSWHSSFCQSFLGNWMKPLQLAPHWRNIHLPSSLKGALAWMVPRWRWGYCINFFYCLNHAFSTLHWCMFHTFQCDTIQEKEMEKWEQDWARYGVRVITASFLLSKRGFTFLFFMFLGFVARRRAN